MSSAISDFIDRWTPQADPVQFAESIAKTDYERCRILAADQHLRWKHHCPRGVHFYLEHWPGDCRSDELLIRLLIDEFSYREEAGQGVSVGHFLNGLPGIGPVVRAELAEILGDGGGDVSPGIQEESDHRGDRKLDRPPQARSAALPGESHEGVEKPKHRLVYQVAESPYVYIPDQQVDQFFIGRQKRRTEDPSVGCDFVIRSNESRKRSLKISRRHLEIHRNDGGTYVVNRSKHGAELNGQKLRRGHPLLIQSGDRLSIAGVLTICVLGRDQIILGATVDGGQVIRLGNDDSTVKLEASVGDLTRTEPEIGDGGVASTPFS